jgi:hypothetical protein
VEAAVADHFAKSKIALDNDKIQECIQNCKGVVMMAYPMGLPDWVSYIMFYFSYHPLGFEQL